MQSFVVQATPRQERGKNAARRIRRSGQVPAVLYGGTREPVPVTVNAKEVAAILRSEAGRNTILTVKLPGGEQKAILKDWQADPVKGTLLHVDLLRVAMDVRMRVRVPVHPVGEPQGVKLQEGIFEMVTREVEIECLPGEIPGEFKVDVTPLMIGMQLRVADLALDRQNVKLITDPQRVIAHVVAPRAEEEEKPAEAVAAVEAAPVEPEVIKKGKKEVEEGAEAEGEQK